MSEKINNTLLPVTRARRNLIARLVREVADQVRRDTNRPVDEDRLERIIDCWLPQSVAESEAAYEEARAVETELATAPSAPTKPSPIDRLRKSLGHDAKVSLRETLVGAAEFIEKAKEDREDVT